MLKLSLIYLIIIQFSKMPLPKIVKKQSIISI